MAGVYKASSRISRRPLRVVLFDDVPFPKPLNEAFARAGVNVIACVNSTRVLLNVIRLRHPDLVLTEVDLSSGDASDVIAQVNEHYPEMPVVAFSETVTDHAIFSMRNAGAHGFILKSVDPKALRPLLRRALAGDRVYCQGVFAHLEGLLPTPRIRDQTRYNRMTSFQRTILDLLILGLTNDEIAIYLNESPQVVKKEFRAVCKNYDVTTRVGLAVTALRDGVDPFIDNTYRDLIKVPKVVMEEPEPEEELVGTEAITQEPIQEDTPEPVAPVAEEVVEEICPLEEAFGLHLFR